MKASIMLYRREAIEAPHSGFRSVPVATLTGEIVLQINEVKLVALLGPRALRAKGKRATLGRGAIVARAVELREGSVP